MAETQATAAQVLRAGVDALRAAGVADPRRDARLLLADALGLAPDRVSLALPEAWPEDATPRWEAHLQARTARQPVAQILGYRAFWRHRFEVTGDVLDPRPETEQVVEVALHQPAARVLDIGTGSGCILLSVLSAWPDTHGVGTDLSPAALAAAGRNAMRLGVDARVTWHETSWAAGVTGPFDLVVSNPPYIGADEIEGLAPEVRLWEPREALSPGADALAAYRALIPQAAALLTPGGRLILEIGHSQAAAVQALCGDAGLQQVTALRDLQGHDRVVTAARPG